MLLVYRTSWDAIAVTRGSASGTVAIPQLRRHKWQRGSVSEQARHCVDKQYSAFVVWKNMVVGGVFSRETPCPVYRPCPWGKMKYQTMALVIWILGKGAIYCAGPTPNLLVPC